MLRSSPHVPPQALQALSSARAELPPPAPMSPALAAQIPQTPVPPPALTSHRGSWPPWPPQGCHTPAHVTVPGGRRGWWERRSEHSPLGWCCRSHSAPGAHQCGPRGPPAAGSSLRCPHAQLELCPLLCTSPSSTPTPLLHLTLSSGPHAVLWVSFEVTDARGGSWHLCGGPGASPSPAGTMSGQDSLRGQCPDPRLRPGSSQRRTLEASHWGTARSTRSAPVQPGCHILSQQHNPPGTAAQKPPGMENPAPSSLAHPTGLSWPLCAARASQASSRSRDIGMGSRRGENRPRAAVPSCHGP